MKRKILAFSLVSTLFFTVNAFAYENTPEYNPKAVADFNANLNVNDLAIAVDSRMGVKTVKIFEKKDNLYLVGPKDITNWEIKNMPHKLKWYKANSLYTYYDISDFNNRVGKYKKYVQPYLLCLAQKYKFRLEIVTGSQNWPTYYIKDKQEYEEQKQKLGELKKELANFEHLPNTFLSYQDNPAIWNLVAKDADEYLECLAKVKNPEKSKLVDFYIKEIEASKKSATNFKGGIDGLYTGASYSWIERSVSLKARKEFIATQTGWNSDQDAVTKINSALDDLKIVAIPKLKLLKINPSFFTYRDANAESLMKGYLKNPAKLKIYKIGLSENSWLIAKNDFGIPLYRYKRGQMLVKNNSDDHGFCKGLFFEIRQDYAGGGTYAASRINGYHEEIYGCP